MKRGIRTWGSAVRRDRIPDQQRQRRLTAVAAAAARELAVAPAAVVAALPRQPVAAVRVVAAAVARRPQVDRVDRRAVVGQAAVAAVPGT